MIRIVYIIPSTKQIEITSHTPNSPQATKFIIYKLLLYTQDSRTIYELQERRRYRVSFLFFMSMAMSISISFCVYERIFYVQLLASYRPDRQPVTVHEPVSYQLATGQPTN
jgi:hypothetical protein